MLGIHLGPLELGTRETATNMPMFILQAVSWVLNKILGLWPKSLVFCPNPWYCDRPAYLWVLTDRVKSNPRPDSSGNGDGMLTETWFFWKEPWVRFGNIRLPGICLVVNALSKWQMRVNAERKDSHCPTYYWMEVEPVFKGFAKKTRTETSRPNGALVVGDSCRQAEEYFHDQESAVPVTIWKAGIVPESRIPKQKINGISDKNLAFWLRALDGPKV